MNPTSFERICPAIVQQIESKSCESGDEDSGDESESKAKGKHLHVPLINELKYLRESFLNDSLRQCQYPFIIITVIIVIIIKFISRLLL